MFFKVSVHFEVHLHSLPQLRSAASLWTSGLSGRAAKDPPELGMSALSQIEVFSTWQEKLSAGQQFAKV